MDTNVCHRTERSMDCGCAKVLIVTTSIIWDMENTQHHGDILVKSTTTNTCTTLMVIITININNTAVKELMKSNANDVKPMTKNVRWRKKEERTRKARTKIPMTRTMV